MKIIQIARKKLADKSVSWEEVYTPDTAYFKTMYDEILGEGSYFRFEGKDSETGDWHMVVVAPAKMHDPQSKFFAGQRKLPSTYSASGEYFGDLKQALNHADNNWGVSFPSDANLSLSSRDLKGIGVKADKWREENKKDEVVSKFDKKITDPKNDPKSASSKGKLIRIAMAEEKFRNRPPSRYFDLDELDVKMPDDWDQVVAAWPNIVVELEYARALRKNLRDMLMERYGTRGADPEMHKMWLTNCLGLNNKGQPFGSHIVSVGPYLGKKFSAGAANTFSPFTQSLTVSEPEEIQKTMAKAINEYQQEYGVVLNPQDFNLPKMVANKFLQHYVMLNASGKEKLLGAAAAQTGVSTEETGWKSGLQERLEAQQREFLAQQHPTMDLTKLDTRDVNDHIVDAWESYRLAVARGENIPKPPMLSVTQFGNDKYTEGAQRPSGIIKYPAFKIVGNLVEGTRELTIMPSVEGQDLKRIGAGSVIRLTTYNSEGDYRYSKQEHVVDSFLTEQGSRQGVITLRNPMTIDISPPQGETIQDWKRDYLLEVTQRVDTIDGQLVDWSLKDSQIVQRTGFTPERVRNDRKAYDAMFYGFNDMQSALDLGWRTGKYIPKKEGNERIVVERNFTKTDLETFATIKTQETIEAGAPTTPTTPEDAQINQGVQGVQGVGGVGEIPETPKKKKSKKVNEPILTEPEVPTESPAAPPAELETPIVDPEKEAEEDEEYAEFLKKHKIPGRFGKAVGGLSAIAQDLEKLGKNQAAKEVRQMLHKYL